MGGRLALLIGTFCLGYILLLSHLYDLQVIQGEGYLMKVQASPQFLEARRGTIYFTDKHGAQIAIALNKDFPFAFAVPKEIEDPKEAANQLAGVLGESPLELEKKFSEKDSLYKFLRSKLDSELAEKIEALKLKGIYVVEKAQRFYEFDALGAHLLGYVGPAQDGNKTVGQYGLEKLYEATLAGTEGKLESGKLVPPKPGEDVALTIDLNIQTEAERILRDVITKYNADGGGVIVEDPQTGKILALAGYPNFDPNEYSKSDIKNFLNPMVQKVYEPGSIFKIITMAAGIDSGKITPETTYYDTGTLTLNGRTIGNYDLKTHGPYGKTTMTEVIEHSINTGAVFAQRQTGRDIFKTYVEKFGFGEKTNIDLPGEVTGDIKRLSPKEKDIAFATAAYGQGVSLTPIELVNGIAAIANGGNLMRPYLTSDTNPEVIRKVIRDSTARQVTKMMISAVDKAEVAKIENYTLAGKTGTAYIPDFEKGGYTDDVINTYVGFGPTDNAKFVILLKLDNPEGAPVASLTVVPAFRDLAQFILNYYNIAPDRIQAQKTAQ